MRLIRLVASMAFLVCCSQPRVQPGPAMEANAMIPTAPIETPSPAHPEGLQWEVKETLAAPPAPESAPAAVTSPLSEKDTQRLLARLPALTAVPAQQTAFALRGKSLPPPTAGEVRALPFPAPEGAPTAAPKAPVVPLMVRRYGPTGEVPIAAQVGITFSQPMIAVGTADQANATVPVKLSPVVEGVWRWMGTQTLVFAPAVRLPMATAFTTEIAKGTTSVTGGALAQTLKWTFATPPIGLQGTAPRDQTDVDLAPLIFASFDQRINPKALLPHIDVKAGKSRVETRLASPDEIEADEHIRSLVLATEPGRSIVLRPVKPLPMATRIQVTVAAGAPSAEGPLVTKTPQSFAFTTYGPFVLAHAQCWGDPCRPDGQVELRFSNSIDPASFEDAMVKVDPPFDAKVTVSGPSVIVSGRKKSRTRYTVSLDGPLRDVHGQRLQSPARHTFDVGDAWPRLQLAREGFVTMTPESPRLDVISAGQPTVHVALYRVTPADWAAYSTFQSQVYGDSRARPPGKLVRESDMKVSGSPDDVSATSIDLAQALTGGTGNVVLVVTGKRQYRDEPARVTAWVQVTRLGLDAFSDASDAVAWVTELSTGAPVAGAKVELVSTKASGVSDGDGIARFALPPVGNDLHERVLVAHRGDDSVMLPKGNWYASMRGSSYLTWVTDDRGMYKPGETASFKGFVRRMSAAKNAKLESAGVKELRYVVNDPRGSKIAEGTTKVSVLGGFDFSVKLPDNANLGSASVTLSAGDTDNVGYHSFEIQEFRRPEFEVSASVNDGIHMIGDPQEATVKASYYAGGALTGAPVRWDITAQRARFTPPGRDAFIFGVWRPWWFDRYDAMDNDHLGSTQVTGATDARGMHRVAIATKSVSPETPVSMSAQASVTDVNRQTWSAQTSMLVHAGATYVGVKPERLFVEPRKPAVFEILAVDLDGKAESGRALQVTIDRTAVKNERGSWHEEQVREADVQLTSTEAPLAYTFTPREGGRHHVVVVVRDGKGRANRTELTLWVAGEKQPQVDEVAHQDLTLIPSKKTYAPGETAEVLVQSPFAKADGLVLIERNGLLSTERIHLDGPSTIVKLPLTKEHAPNVHLVVELAGSAVGPEGDARPGYATGVIDLSVSTAHLALGIEVVPARSSMAPGESTTVTAIVKDPRGKPVDGAEVAIIVVDEALLALSGFTLRDPLETMTPHRDRDVYASYTRDSVIVPRRPSDIPPEPPPAKLEQAEGAAPPMMMMMADSPAMPKKSKESNKAADDSAPEIATRKDFSALAAFVPKLTTDGQGKVTTTVKLPDNLTRYRVMAVAAGSVSEFGKGEATITARLPLMVRPSPPRFLNFGDRFELPAVVQNQTEQAMDVDIVARALNLEIEKPGVRVRVAPGQRVEVRFPAKTVSAGAARFQIGAASGKTADAADLTIKVWTPATTESFATYGVVDGDAVVAQPLAAPADVFPQAGGLTVSTASTALQSLSDAVLYLSTYPFACSEQLASRILALTAMKDVLAAFASPELPSAKELAASVAEDLRVLATRQTSDGGFGFWESREPSPYASVHVTHALLRAKAAGYTVSDPMLQRAMDYLRGIERALSDYPESARQVVLAYALAVRARAGDVDGDRTRALVAKLGVKKIDVEALGNLATVASRAKDGKLTDEIVRELERRVTETASSAHFVTDYADGAHLILSSERRADAVVLGGLLVAQPTSDLVPKVVRGLLDARRHGRWKTTQENVFVLLALGDYFQAFEKQTPEFVTRMWLGREYAGEVGFHGRDAVTRELTVPMTELLRQTASGAASRDLLLQKKGSGRLYYRVGLDYAPKSLDLKARDAGFEVTRTYEAVDSTEDVRRDADGTWHVKAGALVRVKIGMVAPSVRYHVALVDPLPAGFEAVNLALAVSQHVDDGDGGIPTPRYAEFWWRSEWYEHQNLRDERVEVFGTEVWAGDHAYSYVARATTPGTYVVPPTKAEEMYAPETFGRSASTRVVVE